MENATDALYIAGAMMLFLIALSVTMFSITSLRQSTDAIFSETETISMAKGSEGYINFMESKENGSVRIVGSETAMSNIYRAIKENFVVYLKLSNSSYDVLRGKHIENLTISQATQNIKVGDNNIISIDDDIIKITLGRDTNQEIISIFSNGLYDVIKDKSFYEYMGEYQDYTEDGVSTENKKINRIVTYVEI